MLKKLRRSNDWLSYNLCFKDWGFPTDSTILIGILVVGSNLKPLNVYLEMDW
jgi:hypothetical protein